MSFPRKSAPPVISDSPRLHVPSGGSVLPTDRGRLSALGDMFAVSEKSLYQFVGILPLWRVLEEDTNAGLDLMRKEVRAVKRFLAESKPLKPT